MRILYPQGSDQSTKADGRVSASTAAQLCAVPRRKNRPSARMLVVLAVCVAVTLMATKRFLGTLEQHAEGVAPAGFTAALFDHVSAPVVDDIAVRCKKKTGAFACDARHRSDLASYSSVCAKALPTDSWRLCAPDFAIGVISSAKTLERLALSEHWILPALKAGAAVRIFFAGKPDLSRVPPSLRHLVVVLDMAESDNHLATAATLAMNARLLEHFPGRKWYAKVDDDAFFMLSNLLRAMNQYLGAMHVWSSRAHPDLSNPLSRSVIIGKLLKSGTHISGGAVYVQSAFALAKAVPAIRANLNHCTKGYAPSEDIVVTCVHRALKSLFVSMPGMYFNSLTELTSGVEESAADEGLVRYPVSFHWVNSHARSCPLLACYFCTEHVASAMARGRGVGTNAAAPAAHCANADARHAASGPTATPSLALRACSYLFSREACWAYGWGDHAQYARSPSGATPPPVAHLLGLVSPGAGAAVSRIAHARGGRFVGTFGTDEAGTGFHDQRIR